MYLRIPPLKETKIHKPTLPQPIINQYDNLFKRKEEIILRIETQTDSDDSEADIFDSPGEEADLKKSKQFLMSHQMPNKGIVNQLNKIEFFKLDNRQGLISNLETTDASKR